MGAPRRKNLIASRRRIEDEGEEEDSLAAGIDDDSLSEGSAITDADDDADAEASDASDVESIKQKITVNRTAKNGHSEATVVAPSQPKIPLKKSSLTHMMRDTDAMMNGLKISGDADEGEAIDFDDIAKQPPEKAPVKAISDSPVKTALTENLGDKRRRDHQEYRKKRDADPAFVPNRGGFFMHDHRSTGFGQNGFRPGGRGRGRGRGNVEGSSPTVRHLTHPPGPADSQWAHDLHETVVDLDTDKNGAQSIPSQFSPQEISRSVLPPSKPQPPNRSFSRTTRIGNVQIRVFLAGMSNPITFSGAPVNQHTRLPHHRPPLRRDKPVRVSLPNIPVQHVFPSPDRSFIFIPRALRPNQQGFGRARGRGSFGGYSGIGGPSSRRTSAYAGSTYSPSVAMSRRSSMAKEASAEGGVQTANLSITRVQASSATEPGIPRVRLPPAAERSRIPNQDIMVEPTMLPLVNIPQQVYPLPQKPTFRENRPAPIPMHQPRPQKTVSVADIESPATMDFNPPPQQQQQPFHQQVPIQVTGQMYASDMPLPPHSRHASYPSQASGGTPLSQIPEQAIHAPPFQPYPYQPPQSFYPQQMPPPIFYFPPNDQMSSGVPSIAAPSFVPGQQYTYPIPVPTQPPPAEANSKSNTVAHESNGMVYYYDSSQLAANAETNAAYQLAAYPLPQPGGVIGMGGVMTPPQYFPQPTVYYPSQ